MKTMLSRRQVEWVAMHGIKDNKPRCITLSC